MHYEGAGKSGGTEIEWEHQLLVCVDNVNLLGDNRDTIEI
jgi:hypothetical protein